MRTGRLFLLCFGSLLIVALLFVALASYAIFVRPLDQTTTFKVYKGESLRSLSYRMQLLGLTKTPWIVEWYGRIRGYSTELRHGEYAIQPHETIQQLLAHVVAGDVYMRDFQIIEGWTYAQVRQALFADDHLIHTLKNMTDQQLMQKLGSVHDKPEGLLFPDTYAYSWGDSDFDVVARAYYRMQKELSEQWQQRSEGLPYKNAYQALIMASLIEKETALDKERTEIAGVLVRRLKIRMRLQVDPTVVYGAGKPFGATITRTDLKTETPYNTYTNYGLPPTPIDMPSLASIHAAMHPMDGTALYYVAKDDGSHQFSDTYKEHRQAVNEYQR